MVHSSPCRASARPQRDVAAIPVRTTALTRGSRRAHSCRRWWRCCRAGCAGLPHPADVAVLAHGILVEERKSIRRAPRSSSTSSHLHRASSCTRLSAAGPLYRPRSAGERGPWGQSYFTSIARRVEVVRRSPGSSSGCTPASVTRKHALLHRPFRKRFADSARLAPGAITPRVAGLFQGQRRDRHIQAVPDPCVGAQRLELIGARHVPSPEKYRRAQTQL